MANDWDFDNWLLIRHACFAQGIRKCRGIVPRGYETIPADIQEAIWMAATQRMNEIENSGRTAENACRRPSLFYVQRIAWCRRRVCDTNEYKRKGGNAEDGIYRR